MLLLGRGFKPNQRHCVVFLSKNINSSFQLWMDRSSWVQPRKTRALITERLLMRRKNSNQTINMLLLLLSADFFFKFQKNSFRNCIRVSNSLDLDQDRYSYTRDCNIMSNVHSKTIVFLDAYAFTTWNLGAKWLSSGVLDLRPKCPGFKPHRRHCVMSLSKTH